MDAEILSHIGSLEEALSNEDCQQLYGKNAGYLEVREFVVKYSLGKQLAPASNEINSASAVRNRKYKHRIPIVSTRGIVNSLLEEERYEESVRFLVAIGEESIIQDKSIVKNMLAVFRPTSLVEKDLKDRSSFLLETMKKSNIDSTSVWKVDNERRRLIARSQQSILAYLSSVCDSCQFVRPWFEECFSDNPSLFDDYLKMLVSAPEAKGDGEDDGVKSTTAALENEMYTYRFSLACVLLKQMRADLALHINSPEDSMIYSIIYGVQEIVALSRWAKTIGNAISAAAAVDEENSGERARMEKKLASLLANMMFTVASCGAIDMRLAIMTIHSNPDVRCSEWIGLVDMVESDTVAIILIDHLLVAQFRFDLNVDKRTAHLGSKVIALPPGCAKTVFCLQSVRPTSSSNSLRDWRLIVPLLGRLVQRTVSAYGSRMYHVNSRKHLAPDGSSSGGGGCAAVILATRSRGNGGVDARAMHEAFKTLVGHLEAKLPRSTNGNDTPTSSSGKGRSEKPGPSQEAAIATVYRELDLIESFLQQL